MKKYSEPIKLNSSISGIQPLGQYSVNVSELKKSGIGVYITTELLQNFSEYLLPINSNGKIGFINSHAEIVIEPQYDAFKGTFEDSESFVAAMKNQHWYIINSDGKAVLDGDYMEIYIFNRHYAVIRDIDYKRYLIDVSNGDILIPKGRYSYIFPSPPKNYVEVRKSNKCGIIDFMENVIVPIEYDWVSKNENGTYRVIIGEYNASVKKFGLYKDDGTLLRSPHIGVSHISSNNDNVIFKIE